MADTPKKAPPTMKPAATPKKPGARQPPARPPVRECTGDPRLMAAAARGDDGALLSRDPLAGRGSPQRLLPPSALPAVAGPPDYPVLKHPAPTRLLDVHARCAATLFDGRSIRGRFHRRFVGIAEEDPEWCFAVLTGGSLDAALAEALATLPDDATWSVLATGFPGEPAGLRELLEDRGWVSLFHQCWLSAPARAGSIPAVAGVAIREFANRADLEGLIATFTAVHGEGSNWESALRKGLSMADRRPDGGQAHHLVAVTNGEVIGIGSVVVVDGVAGLYNLAVRRDWRRRGVGRALTVGRQRLAADLGCDSVLLLTDRRRVAAWHERYGFREEFWLDGWCHPDRCGPSDRRGGGTDER